MDKDESSDEFITWRLGEPRKMSQNAEELLQRILDRVVRLESRLERACVLQRRIVNNALRLSSKPRVVRRK